MKRAIRDWWSAVLDGLRDPETWLLTMASVLLGVLVYSVLEVLG